MTNPSAGTGLGSAAYVAEGLSGGFHFSRGAGGIDAVIALYEKEPQTTAVVEFIGYLKKHKAAGCLNFGVTAVDGASREAIAAEMVRWFKEEERAANLRRTSAAQPTSDREKER